MAYTTVNKSTNFFNTKLYTGNNTSQSITGVGFQPDWSWIKSRTNTEKHVLQNALMGTGYELTSQDNSAQNPTSTSITSFNSDGITVGSANAVNDNNINYVSWNWKANGLGSTNSDGTITSTYTSANTTSGFSIVTYTGTGSAATVGHGLGVKPAAILVKRLNAVADWNLMIFDYSLTQIGLLNDNVTFYTPGATTINGSTTTSSVIGLGTGNPANGSGSTYVAHCFANTQGFSKMGKYVGNGSADGTFVYTGFKPAYVLIKNATAAESWYVLDNKRPGYNTNNYYSNPNNNGAEGTSTTLATGLLSNGFKPFNSDTSMNTSGQGYVYMAFGQTLVGTNNVPATAR